MTMMSEATEDRIFEAEVVEAVKPEPPPPPTLTREELLEVENLSLKTQLVSQKKELYLRTAQQQLDAFDKELTDLRGTITVCQRRLATKYGIDFAKQQIEAGTGKIIPAGGN
jgi:hypothetical protein